jgi:C-terminal processing protease CtpA/Prc
MFKNRLFSNHIMEFYENLGKSFIDLISRKYSYLSIKTEEFQQIKKGLGENMPKVSNSKEALKILIDYLSLFNDGHVKILDGAGNYYSKFRLKESVNFNNKIADSYLSNKKNIGPITLGHLDEILYIQIDNFKENFKKDFDVLYSLFPSEKKFIIDLRPNSGGNRYFADPLIDFFLGNSEKQIAYYTCERIDENNPNSVSDLKPFFITPKINQAQKKVAVLIGPKTYSAGESTALRLGAIPESITLGEVSGGGSGFNKYFLTDGPNAGKEMNYEKIPLKYDSRFGINLPSEIIVKRNNKLLQNNGITPDILIPNNESIFKDKDLVLEKAINLL